jgi:hypothetical protein
MYRQLLLDSQFIDQELSLLMDKHLDYVLGARSRRDAKAAIGHTYMRLRNQPGSFQAKEG